MRDALVCVIMPVYNTVSWVGQAIDSVLAQTHANLELICVDRKLAAFREKGRTGGPLT